MTCQSVGVVADGSVNMAQTAERVRRSLEAHKHTSGGVKANRRSRFGVGGWGMGGALMQNCWLHRILTFNVHPNHLQVSGGAGMRVSQRNTFGCANDGQMEPEMKRPV